MILNFVMLWRRRKRSVSSALYYFVLDPVQGLGGRHVARRLVDATEEHRNIVELDARALLDLRQHELGEIGVWTTEIEVKLNLEWISHRMRVPSHVAAAARRDVDRA